MEWRQYCTRSFIWCIIIRTSMQCLSRYTTKPINGYSCQLLAHDNITDVFFHQCTHACLQRKNCWTLSYNYPGRYCLLTKEPCVTAEESHDFTMMILRSKETHHCLEWIPFNSTYGFQQGYPKRAVQVSLPRNRSSVVARVVNDQVILTGRSIDGTYKAFLLDSNHDKFIHDHGYEILVIHDTCSTAWMPYSPRETIPAGAVVTGKDNFNKNHHVVSRKFKGVLRIGVYVEGEDFAYHPSIGDNSLSFAEILMLISLDGKWIHPCLGYHWLLLLTWFNCNFKGELNKHY